MKTYAPGMPGIAITKVGCEKKVYEFSKSEPPVQGFPRLCQSPSGSLNAWWTFLAEESNHELALYRLCRMDCTDTVQICVIHCGATYCSCRLCYSMFCSVKKCLHSESLNILPVSRHIHKTYTAML